MSAVRDRIREVITGFTFPEYQIRLDDKDRLDIRTTHVDVATGKPKQFGWRKPLPTGVWAVAANPQAQPGELAEWVAEVVYAELVREAAHEIAERLRWDGLVVFDPHPDEDLGDGVGSAAVVVRFASGRQR